MLEEKVKAPELNIYNQKGEVVKLSDYKGNKVILYFYSKDNTPGCTRQACAFNENINYFKENNIVVLGVSKDSISSHNKFIDKYDLGFDLLSDNETIVNQNYDVWKEKKQYGKTYMGTVRTTYLIDENGYIEKVWKNVKPDVNASQIIEYLQK